MLSPTSVRKQAEHWGYSYVDWTVKVFRLFLVPLGMVGLVAVACIAFPQVGRPQRHCSQWPMLNQTGELGAHICCTSMALISSLKISASSSVAK